ncbi:MAG: hypothetical protein RQ752_13865 [Thermohalobaculum sp.]|nr:hypothetical protein [Thermohalobaculum sp.]
MTRRTDSTIDTSSATATPPGRDARLAEALRLNLQRRKAQARARRAGAEPGDAVADRDAQAPEAEAPEAEAPPGGSET